MWPTSFLEKVKSLRLQEGVCSVHFPLSTTNHHTFAGYCLYRKSVYELYTLKKNIVRYHIMPRARGFSVVLHDVQKGRKTKSDVCDFVTSYKVSQYVIAEEPYNHQGGSHIHVFLQYSSPVPFKQVLDRWCKFWGKIGRVQVDQMRGSMASCCRYVNGQASKQKAYDPDPILMLRGEDAVEAEVPQGVITLEQLTQYIYALCPEHKDGPIREALMCDACFNIAYKMYVASGRQKK